MYMYSVYNIRIIHVHVILYEYAQYMYMYMQGTVHEITPVMMEPDKPVITGQLKCFVVSGILSFPELPLIMPILELMFVHYNLCSDLTHTHMCSIADQRNAARIIKQSKQTLSTHTAFTHSCLSHHVGLYIIVTNMRKTQN